METQHDPSLNFPSWASQYWQPIGNDMKADNIIVKWYTLPELACQCFVRHLTPNGQFLAELVWRSPQPQGETVEGTIHRDTYSEVVCLIEKIQDRGDQGGSPWVGLLAIGAVSSSEVLFTCRADDISLSANYFWQITALLQPHLFHRSNRPPGNGE